jgi:hypothetical protein
MSEPRIDGDIHVIPLGDFAEHEECGDCWCQPTLDSVSEEPGGKNLWVHNRRGCANEEPI